MLPATVNRRLEALEDISKQGKRINGLFRLMEDQILWHEAYANIYANKGAITPGVDGVTLDGFSKERVASIIQRLKDGTYHFQPVRRVYIPKKNKKKRPLGISSGDDKLVQEVVRIILERIYEPIFEDSSHGFRPGRSPHTALLQIDYDWTAVKWMVDMDIRDYFNTIHHELLMSLLEKRIEDRRFLCLIQAMLDAGYLEDWTYHATYSGVPQGSIVSPILANVVWHELDCFMKVKKDQFESGKKRRKHREYQRITIQIGRLRKKWENLKGKEEKKQELQDIKTKIRQLDKMRKKLPSRDPFDETYKRLYYCRFADDFMIGIIGSYADAENIRQQVRQFIQETLKLTIAEEKSHIRHSKQGVLFLGYEVRTFSANCVRKVKRKTRHFLMKTISERIQLHIPAGKLRAFCENKGYGTYTTMKAIHKKAWSHLSDAEIILAYNGELRGLANYYALATGVKGRMSKLARIWQVSLFKTLANKHKTSMQKIVYRLKTNDGYTLKVEGKKKTRTIRVFQLKLLKAPPPGNVRVDIPPNTFALTLSRSELIRRLNAEQCEYCETTQGPFQVHHIRKMKDVAQGKQLWQQMMSARRRKTLILCVRCHQRLHAGTLPAKESPKHM